MRELVHIYITNIHAHHTQSEGDEIWASFECLHDVPDAVKISWEQRDQAVAKFVQRQTNSYFDDEFKECWFLHELFVDPLYESAAAELVQWGKNHAGKEETSMGTIQPKRLQLFFAKFGMQPVATDRVFCQYPMPDPWDEFDENPWLSYCYASGGVPRVVFMSPVYTPAYQQLLCEARELQEFTDRFL